MKSLNKYIHEKLIINKNFKNTNQELDDIINLITDGEKSELKRNGMTWGYRLKYNVDMSKDLLKSIEKTIKQKYTSINVDVNKHLDEGLVVITVSNLDNTITFHKSVLDDNRIIELSIYPTNDNLIIVKATYVQGTHSSVEGWEIRSCYKMPIDDFVTLFETIVNNDHVVGQGLPTKSDYNKIISQIK
jgi:hypothetical protein